MGQLEAKLREMNLGIEASFGTSSRPRSMPTKLTEMWVTSGAAIGEKEK